MNYIVSSSIQSAALVKARQNWRRFVQDSMNLLSNNPEDEVLMGIVKKLTGGTRAYKNAKNYLSATWLVTIPGFIGFTAMISSKAASSALPGAVVYLIVACIALVAQVVIVWKLVGIIEKYINDSATSSE